MEFTSSIKMLPVHFYEQVNIHINTSRKTSTVQVVTCKNHRMRHFLTIRDSLLAAISMSFGVKLRNSTCSILKTADAIELKTFNKIYVKDV